jgi:hypothetical protein
LMPLAASKLIAPPFPALPNSEDDLEDKVLVVMLPLAASKLIAPPFPALPE